MAQIKIKLTKSTLEEIRKLEKPPVDFEKMTPEEQLEQYYADLADNYQGWE